MDLETTFDISINLHRKCRMTDEVTSESNGKLQSWLHHENQMENALTRKLNRFSFWKLAKRVSLSRSTVHRKFQQRKVQPPKKKTDRKFIRQSATTQWTSKFPTMNIYLWISCIRQKPPHDNVSFAMGALLLHGQFSWECIGSFIFNDNELHATRIMANTASLAFSLGFTDAFRHCRSCDLRLTMTRPGALWLSFDLNWNVLVAGQLWAPRWAHLSLPPIDAQHIKFPMKRSQYLLSRIDLSQTANALPRS